MPPRHAQIAPSLSRVQPSRIREIAELAFGREDVYRLHFGESNLPTPQYIKDAAIEALQQGWTFYSENGGLPSLKEALARKIAELHRVALDPHSEILITNSGVQALNISIRCVLDPGDEAIVLTPNWPNGSEIIRMFGAAPVEISFVDAGHRLTPDMAALEAAVTPRTRLLLYTSPSNPLGWVASLSEQRALLGFARRHGLWLMADEVYERIYAADIVAPSILRTAPGVAFGKGGEGGIRICTASDLSVLEPALERLIDFIRAGNW